jgi:hypothetical protein
MECAVPDGLLDACAMTGSGLTAFELFRATPSVPPPLPEQAEFVAMVRTTPVVLEMRPDADPAPKLDLSQPPTN